MVGPPVLLYSTVQYCTYPTPDSYKCQGLHTVCMSFPRPGQPARVQPYGIPVPVPYPSPDSTVATPHDSTVAGETVATEAKAVSPRSDVRGS